MKKRMICLLLALMLIITDIRCCTNQQMGQRMNQSVHIVSFLTGCLVNCGEGTNQLRANVVDKPQLNLFVRFQVRCRICINKLIIN